MRKALIFALAALAFPAAASASTSKQYVLPHPKREYCKAHYVKKVKRVKGRQETVCTYVRTPTSSNVDISPRSAGLRGVSGSVWVGEAPYAGKQLLSLLVTYTISNAATGRAVETFTGVSNSYATCAIHVNVTETLIIFSGEAIWPYPGCPLAVPISIPAAEPGILNVTASFAGNSTYAPSVSLPAELF